MYFEAMMNIRIEDNRHHCDLNLHGEHDVYEIYCFTCNSQLGIRLKNSNWIASTKIVTRRDRRLHIHLLSMNEPELGRVEAMLHTLFENLPKILEEQHEAAGAPEIVITREKLTNDGLRGYKCAAQGDIALLVHKCEGRVFLTDRNGYYNDVIPSVFQQFRGEFLLLLSNNAGVLAEDALASDDVRTLASEGGQPTLLLLNAKKRIYTYKREPSAWQKQKLAHRMLESVFKSLPEEEIKDPRFTLQFERLMLPGGVKRELEGKIKRLKQSRDDSGEVLHLHATPEKISFEKK